MNAPMPDAISRRAEVRALAIECRTRAQEFIAAGQYSKAGKELVAARKLMVFAIELEFPVTS